MFGLGMPEVLMILAIALIVIGPKKLPELAKTLGRALGEFKRSAQDFKRSIDLDASINDIDPAPATNLNDVLKKKDEEKDTTEAPAAKDEEKGADEQKPSELKKEQQPQDNQAS